MADLPYDPSCEADCDVNHDCHPEGWEDNEKNIYRWYSDFETIPKKYFENSTEFQLLKRHIQACFEKRDACEKCKRKKVSPMEGDGVSAQRFRAKKQYEVEGYWWNVKEGQHGVEPLRSYYSHMFERDKAKILMDVITT